MGEMMTQQYWINHGRDDGLFKIPGHIQISRDNADWEQNCYLKGFNEKREEMRLPRWTLQTILNHRDVLDGLRDNSLVTADDDQVKVFTKLGAKLTDNAIPTSGEVRTTSSTGGQKGVKPERYDLLPVEALDIMARLYAFGADKYAAHNWRKGYEWSKSYASLMRHATRFWAGEDFDEETGLPHLAGVGFHAFTLMVYMTEHPEFDDRYKKDRVEIVLHDEDEVEEPVWHKLEDIAAQLLSVGQTGMVENLLKIAQDLKIDDSELSAMQEPRLEIVSPERPQCDGAFRRVYIPSINGVNYFVEDKLVDGMTLTMPPGETVSIDARPEDGYAFSGVHQTHWVFGDW